MYKHKNILLQYLKFRVMKKLVYKTIIIEYIPIFEPGIIQIIFTIASHSTAVRNLTKVLKTETGPSCMV